MLKYTSEIVLSCWTHRAKPQLSLSVCTAHWNLQVRPPCQMILKPICPKRHDQMLWLINRNYQGVQTQKAYIGQPQRKPADTWQRTATWERSLFTVIQRMMTVLNQHAPLLPQCTLIAFMSKNVFTDCVALKQQNNRDCKWQETGSSQHMFKVSKGYHTEVLVIHCGNRLAKQVKFFSELSPQSLKDSHQFCIFFFFFKHSLNLVDDRLVCKSKFTLWWLPWHIWKYVTF